MALTKFQRRNRIRKRIRKIVQGTTERPRLSVFRSNKEIYAQLINDEKEITVVAASSLKNKDAQKSDKIEQAKIIGKEIAEKAKSAGVTSVVFDRSGYLYHGRIKALADAAREEGLKF